MDTRAWRWRGSHCHVTAGAFLCGLNALHVPVWVSAFSCTKVYTLFSDVFYFVGFTMYCLLYLLDVFSFLLLSLKLHRQCVYEL